MRRTATEMLLNLEARVAHLENRTAGLWPFSKAPRLPITRQVGPLFISVQAAGNGFSVYVSDSPRTHKFVNAHARSIHLPKDASPSELARAGCLFPTLEEARSAGNTFIGKYTAVMSEATGGF